MGNLKHELTQEKEWHASIQAKYVVLLAKANWWKGKAIDKEEKLSKVIAKLNDISRHFVELEKAQRKDKADFWKA